MDKLPRSFFARNTLTVAKELVGKILQVNGINTRIVETEAYAQDQASHAYHKTERSSIMFDTYGYVYIYLIYGMYYCLNITTDKSTAGAVLIRAVQPLSQLELLRVRRKTNLVYSLCSGPGKLCQALAITKEYNHKPLGKNIRVFDDGFKTAVVSSKRIGITKSADLPWRFFIPGNNFVSSLK